MSKEQLKIISKRYMEFMLLLGAITLGRILKKRENHPIETMLTSVLFINTFNKIREEDLIDKYIDVLESLTCCMFCCCKLGCID